MLPAILPMPNNWSCRSNNVTSAPAFLAPTAAAIPALPPPITTTFAMEYFSFIIFRQTMLRDAFKSAESLPVLDSFMQNHDILLPKWFFGK
jgi:hypothetical protein